MVETQPVRALQMRRSDLLGALLSLEAGQFVKRVRLTARVFLFGECANALLEQPARSSKISPLHQHERLVRFGTGQQVHVLE